MTVNINGEDYELKFTFNSFRYMEDLELSALSDIETHPLKVATLLSQLFYGALNHNPRKVVLPTVSDHLLDTYCADNDVTELITNLVDMLVQTNFFKSLQNKADQQAK